MKYSSLGSSHCGSVVTNQTSAYEDAGSIPGLASMAVSRGVGHRHGSGPELLWLWRRPAATAPIHLLAWELPYAKGMALNKDKKKKKKKERKKEKFQPDSIYRGAKSVQSLARTC